MVNPGMLFHWNGGIRAKVPPFWKFGEGFRILDSPTVPGSIGDPWTALVVGQRKASQPCESFIGFRLRSSHPLHWRS